jgi:hypothetical protein
MHLWKLNRENFEDWPSAKIGPHKNFPLYGIHVSLFVGSGYGYANDILLQSYVNTTYTHM